VQSCQGVQGIAPQGVALRHWQLGNPAFLIVVGALRRHLPGETLHHIERLAEHSGIVLDADNLRHRDVRMTVHGFTKTPLHFQIGAEKQQVIRQKAHHQLTIKRLSLAVARHSRKHDASRPSATLGIAEVADSQVVHIRQF